MADVDITFFDRDSDADYSHWFTHNRATGKFDVIVDVAMLNAVDNVDDLWIRLKAKDHNAANPCACTDERKLWKMKVKNIACDTNFKLELVSPAANTMPITYTISALNYA